jgi:hypothetical protein
MTRYQGLLGVTASLSLNYAEWVTHDYPAAAASAAFGM